MKKGFSVAEAMITLLIVSLALAAAAPMFTKKAKTDNVSVQVVIPSGMIAYFDLTTCPDGWVKLDSKYDGAFIRNIGGNAAAQGIVQPSGAPNITGWFGIKYSLNSGGAFYNTSNYTNTAKQKSGNTSIGEVQFDASRASSVYTNGLDEVRPTNFSALACKKK